MLATATGRSKWGRGEENLFSYFLTHDPCSYSTVLLTSWYWFIHPRKKKKKKEEGKSKRNVSCCRRGLLGLLFLLPCPAKHKKVKSGENRKWRVKKGEFHPATAPCRSLRPLPLVLIPLKFSGLSSVGHSHTTWDSLPTPELFALIQKTSSQERLNFWKPSCLQQWEPEKKRSYHPAKRNKGKQVES